MKIMVKTDIARVGLGFRGFAVGRLDESWPVNVHGTGMSTNTAVVLVVTSSWGRVDSATY